MNNRVSIIKFKDTDNHDCSIELTQGGAIWLGKDGLGCRMYLNQITLKEILPYLLNYMASGNLEGVKDESNNN